MFSLFLSLYFSLSLQHQNDSAMIREEIAEVFRFRKDNVTLRKSQTECARRCLTRDTHTLEERQRNRAYSERRDDPIRKALHSLQHTVARSADDDDEMQRRRGRLCLRFIYAVYKRRGNRHGRPCPSGLPNCVVPTRSPQPRKNDQGKSRVKIPAARGHGQVNFTLSNQVSPLVSRYD